MNDVFLALELAFSTIVSKSTGIDRLSCLGGRGFAGPATFASLLVDV